VIELDEENLFFKTKIFYYSDSVFDVKGYRTVFFKYVKNKVDAPGFNCVEEDTYVIDLTQSLDDLWKNMKRHTHRNIKKAERNGIAIKINENYDDFYKMYLDHINEKKHIKWYDHNKKETFIKYGTLFTSDYNGIILSGIVSLLDENYLVMWVGSSYRFSKNIEIKKLVGPASHLTYWEVIKYAKAKGIKELNSGPSGTRDNPNLGLIWFKEGLGAKIKTYQTYYKDYNLPLKIARNIFRKFKSYKISFWGGELIWH
jgi:lipid II:glycine glycyltransferase (peptidoglycan interpeptide bridge formation enzyme)